MSFSSKPKKIKTKGVAREFKLVQTVSRKGIDTTKTEEVKTPKRGPKNLPSASQPHQPSFSPTKRPKLETFDSESIPFNIESLGPSGKRQTLVFVFISGMRCFPDC